MTKKRKAWAIKGPNGSIFLDTISDYRRGAIEAIVNLDPSYTWESYRKAGYKAIKVEVKETAAK